MKSCRVQPHSMDGTMDCPENTVREHDSAHLSQPDFGWSLPPHFKVPASSRTHHSITRYDVEEIRGRTSRKCEDGAASGKSIRRRVRAKLSRFDGKSN